MKYNDFVKKCTGFPIIESRVVSIMFQETAIAIAKQFSRWVKGGQLIQLKKGIYILPEEFRFNKVNGFYLSAVLLRPSYISMEKALEFYGLIPESVFAYTALTTRRANSFDNTEGKFIFRHIKESLFWGYDTIEKDGAIFYIATLEKALLDYIYINRINPNNAFFMELRLQNTELIDSKRLLQTARRFGRANILLAAKKMLTYIDDDNRGEKTI